MKNIFALLSLFLVFEYAIALQKLQIGVKKRVENCTQRTKKTDLVHIHYVVKELFDK